jgi:4-hydroxymandelate oxidase
VLVDVSERDPSTTLLGRPRPHPIVVAPTAYHRLAHPDGEEATARGAAAADAIFCLSSLATATPADVAAAAPDGTRWFQLYVFRDRGVSHELLDSAIEHGYEAIVITADLPVLGIRERDVRSQYVIPDAVISRGAMREHGALSLLGIGELIDPSLTWSDVEEFASRCDLPVLVKGRTPASPPSTVPPASSCRTTAAASSTRFRPARMRSRRSRRRSGIGST